jgi:ankyrin repeat protein
MAGGRRIRADSNGISTLLMAISNNQIPVAAFLLSQVADPNAAA